MEFGLTFLPNHTREIQPESLMAQCHLYVALWLVCIMIIKIYIILWDIIALQQIICQCWFYFENAHGNPAISSE